MKKLLLILLAVILIAIPASAQWKSLIYFSNDSVYVGLDGYPLKLIGEVTLGDTLESAVIKVGTLYSFNNDTILVEDRMVLNQGITIRQTVDEEFLVVGDGDTVRLNPYQTLKMFDIGVDGAERFSVDSTGQVLFNVDAVSGENPETYFYGYSTIHSSNEYGKTYISTDGNWVFMAENAGYLGGEGQSTVLFSEAGLAIVDDKRLRWGNSPDAGSEYDEAINDALIFGLPFSSKRGMIVCTYDTMDATFTSLVPTTNQADIHLVDADVDHTLKIGWAGDDLPEVGSPDTTLNLQYDGGGDGADFFKGSDSGENPILDIYGYDTGVGDVRYGRHYITTGGTYLINAQENIQMGGQGVDILTMSNKWIQMWDQRGVVYGTDSQGDVRFMWDDSAHASGTNEALIVGMDTSRGIILGAHDLMNGNGGNAYDLTSLFTGRFNQASMIWLDNDRDSYLQLYHSADDVPTIKSNKDLIFDATVVEFDSIRITDNPTNGYYLQCDANGDATWASVSADSQWNSITLGSDAENASGQITWVASDNDQGTSAINTSDMLVHDGFTGGMAIGGEASSLSRLRFCRCGRS